ncbi:MAG: methyltransferase domain-containing protein [Nanoarchaeota archaeon]
MNIIKKILKLKNLRIIIDLEKKLGENRQRNDIVYKYNLNKDQVTRDFILKRDGEEMKFLDIGGRDGKLTYLLGISGNLRYDSKFYRDNIRIFESKYTYFGIDIMPTGKNVIQGNICSESFDSDKYKDSFDIIYSNNVFEHLKKPWVAAQHITKMLKKGGLTIHIVPFSQRYHEDPGDYFRYTHTGLPSLFDDLEVVLSGYDILGRRNDWQGTGKSNDMCPEDRFGAWRETWFTVSVMIKK